MMTTSSGYRLTFVLPPEGVAIAVIIALAISQLAAIALRFEQRERKY